MGLLDSGLQVAHISEQGMELQGFFLFFFLSAVMSYPEIWPPNGRLTANNYLPPPKCRYEQETVMEDLLEEVCTVVSKEECKNITVSTEVTTVVKRCNEVLKEVC